MWIGIVEQKTVWQKKDLRRNNFTGKYKEKILGLCQ